jgi:hypothetical protein
MVREEGDTAEFGGLDGEGILTSREASTKG